MKFFYFDEDSGKIIYESNNINNQIDYKDIEKAYISDSSLVKYFGSESNNHSSLMMKSQLSRLIY